MGDNTITLAALTKKMAIYDSMPSAIQKGMRSSILLTLMTNVACIPLLCFVPRLVISISPVPSGGFFIWFTADVLNFLLPLAHELSGYLLVLNVLSLTMIVLVVLTSWGMTKPVREPVHWLAWVAAFPSGASAVSAAIIVGLITAIIVVALVIWILIVLVVLACIALIGSST